MANAEQQHNWYLRYKEQKREYNRKYRETHKEELAEKRRNRYAEFGGTIRKRNRECYQKHKENYLKQKAEYYQRNKEKIHEREHKYRKPYLDIYLNAGGRMICERCGSVNKLGIHHKDGNHENNLIENLECLCNSCHSKEHDKRRNKNAKGQYTS